MHTTILPADNLLSNERKGRKNTPATQVGPDSSNSGHKKQKNQPKIQLIIPKVGEKAMSGRKKRKVGENNGQLHLQPPTQVVHANHLDQE